MSSSVYPFVSQRRRGAPLSGRSAASKHPARATSCREQRGQTIRWSAAPAADLPRPGEDGTPESIPVEHQDLWVATIVVVVLIVLAIIAAGGVQ